MYKQACHIILYLLIAFIAGDFSKQSGEKALLEKGYQLEAAGEFEEALELWASAVEEFVH